MLIPLLALTLVGCDQVSDLLGGGAKSPAAAPVAAPPKDVAAQLDDARALLRAGKAPKALAAGEALLGAHPEDDAVWDFVELAAIRANAAGELVDRLAADKAIGGRTERHQVLRGVLAVEANRLGDALNAAKALEALAPGDAAAVTAMAVARGAPLPEDASPGTIALCQPATEGVALDPAADALPGWRVALVRAEARLARGDRAGAALDAAAADAGGVRARSLAALVRIRAAAGPGEAWGAAEPAARAALDDGDGVGAAELLDAALPSALVGWKAGSFAGVAGELRVKLTEAGNTDAAARFAAVEAEAALRGGMPIRARDAAKIAAELPATQVRASWTLALAGAALGVPADVEAAAAALAEPRAGAARDLARALRGASPTLPSPGLEASDAALQALLGAGWLADPAAAYAAAAAAADPAAPDLLLWARLAQGRAPLPVAAGDAPAGALLGENAVRTLIASGIDGALPAEFDHPNATGWAARMGGAPAAADAPGVAAWARARAALAAGDTESAASELGALAEASPAWRSGPWAPLLVLDGPLPSELGGDVVANRRAADPVPFAFALHGWAARQRGMEEGWRHGIAAFPIAATEEQRASVWDAQAGLRARTLAWLAGDGAWPAAETTALEEAEKAAGLVRLPPPSLAAVRATLDGDAIISFRESPEGTEVLYVGEQNARLAMLPRSVVTDIQTLNTGLRSGDSAIGAADRVREALIDSAMDVLLGVGRYIIVGPAPYALLPVAALPEQSDAVRFLAAIRYIGYVPTFDAMLPEPPSDLDISLTMVAVCSDALEARAVRRVFPDARILEGEAATPEAFLEIASKARFLHIGGFPASADGGFHLPGGDLTLGEIASTPLAASGVLIAGGTDARVMSARMTAVRRAGASDVLVEGWAADTSDLRESLLLHYWEGINRRYSASRSLSDARALALREAGDTARLPGSWAGYFVAGRP